MSTPQPISVKFFTINHELKRFIGEISTVGDSTQQVGELTLFNPFKNTTSKWQLSVTEGNDDNEIIAWNYIPTAETLTQHPSLKGWKVKIFND